MDELCGIATSRFGISVASFYEMTPLEFDYAVKDFSERAAAEMELQIHTEFEVMRQQTFYQLMANPYVKNKPRTAEKYMPFVWDTGPKPQTLEQQKAIMLAIASAFNQPKEKKK